MGEQVLSYNAGRLVYLLAVMIALCLAFQVGALRYYEAVGDLVGMVESQVARYTTAE